MTTLTLGDDFNFTFDPGMLSTAVSAPSVAPASAPFDFSTLISTVKQQAPSLLTSYVQKRINQATAPRVVQAPAVPQRPAAAAAGSGIGNYAVPAGIALLTVGGIAWMSRGRRRASR